ncbi:MAG: aminoacyl-tRNA hydrolase [Defluviitaleaceae bacterium]|nr:aminoacyl-tRNA hydrolase [Defluviitaleaceae bacterium]MCL2274583.1 aminoacyl-tRNA hydrolase [Defluviitaleaceae bacterium]
MHIIVGLGNPGQAYKGTRHNVGFECIDKLSYDYQIKTKLQRRFRAETGEGQVAGARALLVQPQTYMNLSGEAVLSVLQFYKLPPSALIVVYDDISLPVGDIRVREKGGAGGQKGMANIIARLGTEEFPRVRIGIGAKPAGWDLADYVLSRFKREEFDGFIQGVTLAGEAVEWVIKEGTESAMNRFNKRLAIVGDGVPKVLTCRRKNNEE